MGRRLLIGALAVAAFVLGIAYAWRAASVTGAALLFNSGWWLLVLAPFVGVLAAGLTRRKDPVVEGDKVLRHDNAAIIEHWTHGIGTVVLLVSGIALGARFLPTALGVRQVWAFMNVHFVAAAVFLFGTFYYGANTLLSWKRLGEHLPTKNALPYTIRHFGLLLGFKRFTMPPEDKYFESERAAYLLALVSTIGLVVTGILKALAHVVSIPGFVMGPATWIHDIAAVGILAFFVAHVLFGAILPMGWPMLSSMVTGYVSLEHAKAEHAGWLARISDSANADEDGSSDERDAA